MAGWVKIHRSILDWQWWPDDNMLRLWLYLIITANIEDRKWRNITVKRGQLIVTRKELSETLNISEQSIRTCLNRLEESGEINRQITNKYTIVTICKFDTYQIKEKPINQQINQQSTNNQPTTNQQTEKETSPQTPLKNKDTEECKNRRIYYYSTSAHTREGKQKEQFFYIFWLKGSADPRSEYENFITWNTTPERAASWDSCPEYARYSAARRWRVKGAKLAGYSDNAGKAFTALVDEYVKKYPDFLANFFDGQRYPATVKDAKMTLFCKTEGMRQLEATTRYTKQILARYGITSLQYTITD